MPHSLEEHSFEKWLTPYNAQVVLGGDNSLFIKIKSKCPAGENLEIITFRYHKTLVFGDFLKKLQHLIFLFLKSISDN